MEEGNSKQFSHCCQENCMDIHVVLREQFDSRVLLLFSVSFKLQRCFMFSKVFSLPSGILQARQMLTEYSNISSLIKIGDLPIALQSQNILLLKLNY